MYKRVKVKKGDRVKVLSGEAKGTEGTVLEVIRKDDRVLIEGVNVVTKHVKPNASNPQGGVEKKEAPIHISNVLVIDKQGNPTRVGKRVGADGKLVRFSKKSNEEL
ncbi:MAG: 50S ribosomal protein L24 [Flavobacteriales bacterium]